MTWGETPERPATRDDLADLESRPARIEAASEQSEAHLRRIVALLEGAPNLPTGLLAAAVGLTLVAVGGRLASYLWSQVKALN